MDRWRGRSETIRSFIAGFVAATGTCAVAACAPAAPAAGRAVVFDSAGIQVIRHAEESVRAIIEAREIRRIGTVDATDGIQFDRLVAIESRGDRIFTLDWGDNTVRVISSGGRLLAEFGRRGEGPGELTYAHRMIVGDSVWIVDPAANRLSVFDLDGGFIRDEPLGATHERQRHPLARLGNGWIAEDVDRSRVRGRERDRLHADSAFLVFTHELARYGGDAALGLPMGRSGDFPFLLSPLFEPRGRIVSGLDGETVHAPGLPYRIDIFDRRGRHVRRIEREHPEAAIRDHLVDEYLAYQRELLDPLPRAGEAEMIRQAYLEIVPSLPRPPYRPPVGRLLVGPGGDMLVERPDHDPHPFWPDDPTIWDHLGPTGDLHGRIRFPARATPLSLAADGVWARAMDELDVNYAVLYEIGGPGETSDR